jgi:hypothetical protein
VYELKASVPAGDYHVIFDAIIIVPVEVTFTLIHRRGGTDTTLATWTDQFEPLADGSFHAQTYELPVSAPAIEFAQGDEFVFRYAGANSTAAMAFIPVGNPESEGGRFPNISFPR